MHPTITTDSTGLSKAAATPGSSNVWGLADPAIDALLQKVVSAKTRPELGAAMRALDRVLTHGYYSVPQYYGDAFFIGYRPAHLALPATIYPSCPENLVLQGGGAERGHCKCPALMSIVA